MKLMYPNIKLVCKKMKNYLDTQIHNSQSEFDIKDLSAKYTIDVVCNCLYSIDSQVFTHTVSEIYYMAQQLVKPTTELIVYYNILGIFPMLKNIYQLKYLSKKVKSFYSTLIYDIMKDRKKNENSSVSNNYQNDILNYLMELQKKKNLNDTNVAAHTFTFFMDGYETSSAVFAHALYLLSLHKDVQDKLRMEINDCLMINNNDITFDELQQLEYLDHVFNGNCDKGANFT